METIRTFTVKPLLPEPLKDLRLLANNMFWSWNSEFVELFIRIDSNLWHQCEQNPVKLLGAVTVQMDVFTNFGRDNQQRKSVTIRLKDKEETVKIGEIEF